MLTLLQELLQPFLFHGYSPLPECFISLTPFHPHIPAVLQTWVNSQHTAINWPDEAGQSNKDRIS